MSNHRYGYVNEDPFPQVQIDFPQSRCLLCPPPQHWLYFFLRHLLSSAQSGQISGWFEWDDCHPAPYWSPVLTSLICSVPSSSVAHCATTLIAVDFPSQKRLSGKGTLHICLRKAPVLPLETPFLSPGISSDISWLIRKYSSLSLFKYFWILPTTACLNEASAYLAPINMPSPVHRPKGTGMNEVHTVLCPHYSSSHGCPDPQPRLSMTCFPNTELPQISWYCYFPLRYFKLSFLETYHSNWIHAKFIVGMINICHLSWRGWVFKGWHDSS